MTVTNKFIKRSWLAELPLLLVGESGMNIYRLTCCYDVQHSIPMNLSIQEKIASRASETSPLEKVGHCPIGTSLSLSKSEKEPSRQGCSSFVFNI